MFHDILLVIKLTWSRTTTLILKRATHIVIIYAELKVCNVAYIDLPQLLLCTTYIILY